jgi:hypothetical protein
VVGRASSALFRRHIKLANLDLANAHLHAIAVEIEHIVHRIVLKPVIPSVLHEKNNVRLVRGNPRSVGQNFEFHVGYVIIVRVSKPSADRIPVTVHLINQNDQNIDGLGALSPKFCHRHSGSGGYGSKLQ